MRLDAYSYLYKFSICKFFSGTGGGIVRGFGGNDTFVIIVTEMTVLAVIF